MPGILDVLAPGQDSPCSHPPPGPLGAPPVIQAGEGAGSYKPLTTCEGRPSAKTCGPTVPLASSLPWPAAMRATQPGDWA